MENYISPVAYTIQIETENAILNGSTEELRYDDSDYTDFFE